MPAGFGYRDIKVLKKKAKKRFGVHRVFTEYPDRPEIKPAKTFSSRASAEKWVGEDLEQHEGYDGEVGWKIKEEE